MREQLSSGIQNNKQTCKTFLKTWLQLVKIYILRLPRFNSIFKCSEATRNGKNFNNIKIIPTTTDINIDDNNTIPITTVNNSNINDNNTILITTDNNNNINDNNNNNNNRYM